MNIQLLKEKYPDDYKSKSTNICIVDLYKVLLEAGIRDGDYFYICGVDEINDILANYFIDYDWNELKTDIQHWSEYQLELFTEAIMRGYDMMPHLHLFSVEKREMYTNSIIERMSVLPLICEIMDERGITNSEIPETIRDNINFIIDNFSFFLENVEDFVKKANALSIFCNSRELKLKIEESKINDKN